MKTEQSLLSKKELLDIFINHRVNVPFPGDWESTFKGLGYEFWALRELQRSDSFKNIDWKAKAKTGKYYVREYLAESYFNVMLLYDISASVSFGRKELLQAHIAVSLAFSAVMSNNGCGLILFADDIVSYIPPRMGRSHFMEILAAIARAEPATCRGTSLQLALTKLVTEVPESLTFILSDFMYPLDFSYSFHRTVHGASTHDVKAVQVLEESEVALPAGSRGIVPLYDYETGAARLLDVSKWTIYNETMERAWKRTRSRLSRAGIDLVTITPADDWKSMLNAFMKRAPLTH
jgi:uncharacterized protein (DUF58 family)